MLHWLVWIWGGVSASWWLGQAFGIVRVWLGVPRLDRMDDTPTAGRDDPLPTISLVIAGRNEASELEAALRSKLACDYPRLQVVFVDDRSTDDTLAIAQEVARQDPRLTVVHIDTLPEGWLGKVHALHRGLQHARGEWVLLSDADVHLAPGTLRRCMALAHTRGLDHIAAIPSVASASPGVAVALSSFFRLLMVLARPWRVSDPRSGAYFGSGAFSLFRRDALERTAGLSWLKMEIADDVALGAMLERSGARQGVVLMGALGRLGFYPSLRALFVALEKNGATASPPAIILGSIALAGIELGYLALLSGASTPALIAGSILYGVATAVQLASSIRVGMPRWPALVPGLGTSIVGAAMVRSALVAWMRGGVVWRGTFYPTSVVRAGSRLRQRVPTRAGPPSDAVDSARVDPPYHGGSSR